MRNRICVGIDYNKDISSLFRIINMIEQTKDLVEFFKVNPAFWMHQKRSLDKVIKFLNDKNIKWIYDGKLGDVYHTNRYYAEYVFEDLGAHGATLNPYLGIESLTPFLEYKNKKNFIVCRTSNEGSELIQKDAHEKVYSIAKETECGLVIAGNKQGFLEEATIKCPEVDILCPGIGAQGGSNNKNINNQNVIYSISRTIIESSYPRSTLESFING